MCSFDFVFVIDFGECCGISVACIRDRLSLSEFGEIEESFRIVVGSNECGGQGRIFDPCN